MSNPEKRLGPISIGQMPVPTYLESKGRDSWIGVETYDVTVDFRPFIFWKNLKIGDLISPESRDLASTILAMLKIGMDVEAVIGPAIEIDDCESKSQHVQLSLKPDNWGVYIEEEKRAGFNFLLELNGMEPREIINRGEFDIAKNKAHAVLPIPDSVRGKMRPGDT